MVDDNDDGILNKKIGRRGFLGALGVVGAAAAIPLSWNIAEATDELPYTEGPPPVDISEYIEPGTWEVEPTDVKEEWDVLDPRKLEGSFTGTLEEYKEYKHPTIQVSKYLQNPDWNWKRDRGPVLIGRYDLSSYDINVYADVIENTQFGEADRSYFTRGLREAEVRCTLYGETFITELMKQMDRKLHIVINLGPQTPIAFAFDAYATEVNHTLPPFATSYKGGPLMGEVVFHPIGQMQRIYKGNERRAT